MGSSHDSFLSSNFLLCCSLLISVDDKTYKSAIKRPIKIRTHHVVRKHAHRLTNGRQAVRADRQLDEHSDRQTCKSDTHNFNLSENGKAKEST